MRHGLTAWTTKVVIAVITVMMAGVSGAQDTGVPRDAAFLQARERLADMLASEDFEKVDVSAASFDRAMDLIYTAVDAYLDGSVPLLGDAETAGEFGSDVLQGLNDHTMYYADENGYDIVGRRRLLISSEKDARDLGEVLAMVVRLLDGAHVRPGATARSAARKIFEGMLPVEGTSQTIVNQYLVRLRMLSKADRKELLEYALG